MLQPPLVLYNPWNPLQILTMNQKDDDENEEEEKKKRGGRKKKRKIATSLCFHPLNPNSRFATGRHIYVVSAWL